MTMFGSPPIPDWLQQAPSDASMPPMQPNIAPSMMQTGQVKQKRGGMFGSGLNAGEVIVNLLNGALAGAGNPVGIANIKMMQDAYREKQMRAQEEAQYQRQRQDSMADWQAKQQWELDHPKPINNDTVADYQFIMQQLGPDAGKRFLETKTNPIVMTPYGPMPYSAVNGGGAPASRPVGKLTPIEDGGPTPQASGGFPPFGY